MNTAFKITNPLFPWQDPEFIKNPYPWYKVLREHHPVYQLSNGDYLISRYEDIIKWAKHPSLSIEEPIPIHNPWAALRNSMLFVDPPVHTRRRRITNHWFTPKLVSEWVKQTRLVVEETLDKLEKGETIDAFYELGVRPTHVTMCRVFQIPEDDIRPIIKGMFDTMYIHSYDQSKERMDLADEAFVYMKDRVRKVLADKRKNPGTGLADYLLDLQDKGELTEDEVLDTVTLFFSSGGHNPGYLSTVGIEEFARRPEIMHTYKTRPDLRKSIVNELLRYHPSELSYIRYTTEDIEIAGTHIPAKSTLVFLIASANRDESYFERPDEFICDRAPEASMHLTFGIGIHNCAGQVISRAEIETILTTIAERYESVELVGEPKQEHTHRALNYHEMLVKFY
jgi:cytochrome P450